MNKETNFRSRQEIAGKIKKERVPFFTKEQIPFFIN
jgi:hypothetical protein